MSPLTALSFVAAATTKPLVALVVVVVVVSGIVWEQYNAKLLAGLTNGMILGVSFIKIGSLTPISRNFTREQPPSNKHGRMIEKFIELIRYCEKSSENKFRHR